MSQAAISSIQAMLAPAVLITTGRARGRGHDPHRRGPHCPGPVAGTAALVFVLVATVVLLFGLALVALSVRKSVNAVDYEVDRTLALGSAKPYPPPAPE
ncbi:MAG TPA: hypothetical protein VME46_18490 [Acidimicrobiales bacterium]|nr:hypothetical protein [Acidimicrobiales bacterium]